MATCRERGNGHFEFIVRRKRLLHKPIYLTFTSREAGEAYCTRLETMLDAGIVPDEFKKSVASGTLAKLVRDYVAGHTPKPDDVSKLDLIVASHGSTKLPQLTHGWVTDYVTQLKRVRRLTPGTVLKYTGALSRCLDWAVNKGLIVQNPVKSLPRGFAQYSPDDVRVVGAGRTDNVRDVRLPLDGEERIRAAIDRRSKDVEAYHLLFTLAVETAMRLRELFTLTKDQVSLPERTVFLEKTKNGHKRQVPLSSVAVQVLTAYLEELEGEHLFPWWGGDARDLSRVSARVSKAFGRILADAGLPEVRFHDLRHEATSRLFERTPLSDVQIAKITGHRDPRVLMRYANLRGSDLAASLW